jgi:hypothetical protein
MSDLIEHIVDPALVDINSQHLVALGAQAARHVSSKSTQTYH